MKADPFCSHGARLVRTLEWEGSLLGAGHSRRHVPVDISDEYLSRSFPD